MVVSSDRAGAADFSNREIWEGLYSSRSKVNRYPHDSVVSFVMRHYSHFGDRTSVRLLDYGCGGGGNTAFMANEGFRTFAVDYSVSALFHARETVGKMAADGAEAEFVAADFNGLPFPDASFDAVIDRQSLGQNASGALPGLVGEIFRVLRPGGRYFGVNFSDGHPQLRFGTDMGNGDFADFRHGVFKGIGARHFFSVSEIEKLFRAFELEDLRVMTNMIVGDPDSGFEEICVHARVPD